MKSAGPVEIKKFESLNAEEDPSRDGSAEKKKNFELPSSNARDVKDRLTRFAVVNLR